MSDEMPIMASFSAKRAVESRKTLMQGDPRLLQDRPPWRGGRPREAAAYRSALASQTTGTS